MHFDVFVDTNGFIHLKDLKDQRWQDLFPGVETVNVIVAASIIRELDHHKMSTNERRRDRARLALKMVDAATEREDFTFTLRETPVVVRLVLSRTKIDWAAVPQLDQSKPDDRFVAEAWSYSPNAVVLSNDSGPRIAARSLRMRAPVPADDWRLEPEKTDEQRKIARLERELERALSSRPTIEAYFDGFADRAATYAFEVPILRELNGHEKIGVMAAYVHVIKNMYRQERDLDPMSMVRPGSTRELFEQYEDKVLRFLADLHGAIMRYQRVGCAAVVVKNISGVAAEGLRLHVKVSGAYLIEEDSKMRGSVTPPERPAGSHSENMAQQLRKYAVQAEESDPLAFRWMQRPGHRGTEGVYQCREFRATQEKMFGEWVYGPDDLPTEGDIRIEIGATNMSKPLTIGARFTMREVPMSWNDERVLGALHSDLANSIRQANVR